MQRLQAHKVSIGNKTGPKHAASHWQGRFEEFFLFNGTEKYKIKAYFDLKLYSEPKSGRAFLGSGAAAACILSASSLSCQVRLMKC